MRTVTYDSILRGSVELAGQTFPPLAQDGLTWRGWIEKELQTAWEAELWPDLMRTEQRYLRGLYDAVVTYAAGAEIYYPTERKYYTAIRVSTGNAPTSLAYFSESKLGYSASDYSAAAAYVAGSQVYYPVTDLFYQAHTAGTNHVPTNASFWGPLVPFVPVLAYEQTGQNVLGDVVGVWNKNPRVFTSAARIPYRLTDVGVSLWGIVSSLWVEYRIRPRKFFGDVYDVLSTYDADDQVYLSPDFYTANTPADAGETPLTAPNGWDVVSIPEIFKAYVIHAAYVRWLRSDGQNDKAAQEGAIAGQELVRVGLNLARTMRQSRAVEVLTR